MQLTFLEFQYYQGGYFKYDNNPNHEFCDPNAIIEAGFSEKSSEVLCSSEYQTSTILKKCLKVNAKSVTLCTHDMNLEDGKCYSCPRGFGNENNGVCYKCADNCLTCNGPFLN